SNAGVGRVALRGPLLLRRRTRKRCELTSQRCRRTRKRCRRTLERCRRTGHDRRRRRAIAGRSLCTSSLALAAAAPLPQRRRTSPSPRTRPTGATWRATGGPTPSRATSPGPPVAALRGHPRAEDVGLEPPDPRDRALTRASVRPVSLSCSWRRPGGPNHYST